MESEMKIELENIKKQMSLLAERQEYLEDALITAEDEIALSEARKDLAEKKTINLSNIKRELGI